MHQAGAGADNGRVSDTLIARTGVSHAALKVGAEIMHDDTFAGFVRVAAAVPRVRVTDFAYNRDRTLELWQQASDEGCAVVYFPELGLSAYTAGDLHMDRA